MKLQDPRIERDLLRLAHMGRGGKPMERADRSWLGGLQPYFGITVFFLAAPFFIGQILERGGLDESWRHLLACAFLMGCSIIGGGRIQVAVFESGIYHVLANLPIGGAHALRWIRSRKIGWDVSYVLLVAWVIGFRMSDHDSLFEWQVLGRAVMIVLMVLATAHLLDHPWILRSKLWKSWMWFTGLSFVTILGAMFFRLGFVKTGGSPGWLLDGVDAASWILPTSWVLGGRFEGGAWLLAVPWVIWGVSRACSWPQRMRHAYDGTVDLWDGEDEDLEDGCEYGEAAVIGHGVERAEDNRVLPVSKVPEALPLGGDGWVDRWVRFVLGGKYRELAAILLHCRTSWTLQANWMLVAAPFWFVIWWLYIRYLPEWDCKPVGMVVGWIVFAVVLCAGFFPVTNAIPRAVECAFMGFQKAPLFSVLPMTCRDLLRVSMRITVARCAVMLLVVPGLVHIQCRVFFPSESPWPLVGLVPALCVFWIAMRPAFVWYRLKAHGKARRGWRLAHGVAVLLGVLFSIGALVAGGTGLVLVFCSGLVGVSTVESMKFIGMAAGCFATVATVARAVFEVFLWEVRSGRIDWISSV